MAEISIIQINREELKNIVFEAIRGELEYLKVNQNIIASEEYLTREETAKKLKISLPTLDGYTKKGVIEGYRLGTLVRYKKVEVEASLKQIPIIKYRRNTK
jgi:excisionase family DNA binding protein